MQSHRLNLSILAHLLFILGVGMFLVDAVILMAARTMIVKSELSRCDVLLTAVTRQFRQSGADITGPDAVPPTFAESIAHLFHASDIHALLLTTADGKPISVSGTQDADIRREMTRMARKALTTKMKQSRLTGSTWGVFRSQQQFALISAPVASQGRTKGAVCIALDMGRTYAQLRRSQQLAAGYILMNLLMLSLYGLYQINRLAIRPLRRLLRQVESFQSDDDFSHFADRPENEFGQLSQALNRMLHRISDDKRELRSMVKSLQLANDELKQAQTDVINAEKHASVGRLAAGVAHEIGNPIAIVSGYVELLKNPDTDENDRNDITGRIGTEIERIHTIIRQLLDFSRPSGGESAVISVHDVIADAVAVMALQPFMKSVRLEVLTDADRDQVRADPSQLQQVLVNLVLNAADAIKSAEQHPPEESHAVETIIIATQNPEANDGGLVRLTVTDTGIGIPEERAHEIFDPFFTTKSPGEGTGLGLSVSFTIIESFGGKIYAAPAPSGGTKITVDLPLIRSPKEDMENGI